MSYYIPRVKEYDPDDTCEECGADVYYVGRFVYCGNCDKPEFQCGCPEDPRRNDRVWIT